MQTQKQTIKRYIFIAIAFYGGFLCGISSAPIRSVELALAGFFIGTIISIILFKY